MRSNNSEKILQLLLLATVTTTTLFIAPWSVTHPYSVPKLIPLISFSLTFLPLVFTIIFANKDKIKNYNVILILICAHFISSLLVLINQKNNLTQELYGVWGRSNGFLSHFSFIILMLVSLFYPIKKYLSSFIKTSLVIGLITLIYGVMQSLKLVKISKIDNENTQATGFFGNENFYSAFIGIISVVCLSIVFDKKSSKLKRINMLSFSILGNIGIYISKSQQGFLVFLVGALIIFLAYINASKYNKLLVPYIFSCVSGLIIIVLGFFQIGPLTKYVYQDTLTFRGYYWRAGIKMFLDNPILGIGFDSYRDFYRRYRDTDSVRRLGATDISDSAHNYFIDIAVNGGLFLLTTYLLIIIFVLICTIKLLVRMREFNAPIVAIIAAWYAFMTQSFVSLPQPGLTLWGWILSGLVVAIYKQSNSEQLGQEWKLISKPPFLAMGVFLVIGLMITIPPFKASAEYRRSLEAQDISILIKAAKMFPQDATMVAASGGALIGLDRFTEAKELLKISIERFPQYYESWYIYSLLPNLSPDEKSKINKKMAELEPLLINTDSNE